MLGVFGGTFDPIHFGHLRVALDVVEALDLERLHLIPLHVAAHRGQPLASPEQRLAMARIATRDEPRLMVDDRELRRSGPSFTVDTLRAIRIEHPNQSICLLLGSDAFEGFLGWHEPRIIMGLAHLIVMQRPGYRLPENTSLRALVDSRRTPTPGELHHASGGLIFFLPVTQLSISSTSIRERLYKGLSARYLTPNEILQFIESENIYSSAP
jgi:nicotinate-nucleotide adenylyltransferase